MSLKAHFVQISAAVKTLLVEGTVMQIEKALIYDPLRVSKVSWRFRIPTILKFAIIYP